MDDPETSDLLRDLVHRLLSSRFSAAPSTAELHTSLRFAHRLISSRLSPSLSPDEPSASAAITRHLALSSRPSAALTFSDLHSKLSLLPSPRNRWALLSLSRRHNAVNIALPALPLDAPAWHPRKPVAAGAGAGTFLVSKDPDNIREISLREYADLVAEDTEPTEESLVRDVLYACQGIDGRYVRLDNASDSYDVSDTLRLPRSTRVLLRRLCELGWLFRKVKGYITESMSRFPAEDVGTVRQALCAALQDELSDYYKMLAVLEAHSLHPIPPPGSDPGGPPTNYLSLRRLAVWLAEPMVKMRVMAVLVDGCRSLRGGAMAGAIHAHAQHGDPLVREFMDRLLRRVCSPLFEMVRSWVLEGELEDYFTEFFILSQPVKAESLWREGYQIQSAMLPSFISPTLAQQILRTGKSINFLRVCCEDRGWAEAATEAAAHVGAATSRGSLGYGETNALEALVGEAARRIDRRLMDVINRQFRFRDHCIAIKRYLLLGQGDFVQYLMDIVGGELSVPANTISSFQLAGLLESAIRASNAQYEDRDILNRLKVKMMDHGDGDQGWDVFSLEYDARVPLDTVFTASTMKRYLRVFNFLWKVKRIEHALIGLWKTMKPNCIVSCIFAKEAMGVKVQFVSVLRKCQVLWNEMNHFIMNFQCYIMFEVLEVSWARFSEEMDSAKDLDDLLAAHEKYLSSIWEKSLLGERSQGILRTLFVLFDLILQYRSKTDGWFEQIFDLQNRSLRGKNRSKSKSKPGSWLDGGRKVLIQATGEILRTMSEELELITKEYSSSLDTFISQLPMQQHVNMKFLLFRLDFTKYYSRLFDEMSELDIVSWSSMISGYASKGMWKEAFKVFERIQRASGEVTLVAWNVIAGGEM